MTNKSLLKQRFFLTPPAIPSILRFYITKGVYTLDSVEPDYLGKCRGVHEKVHDSPPSTRL